MNTSKSTTHTICLALVSAFGLFVITFALFVIDSPLNNQTAFAQDEQFAGEKVVHLLDEPRHRTVHHWGDIYLLDVQVNPGDISFAHVHDQAIMLTFMSRGDGPRPGDVSSNIDYATEPLTHKVSNDGPGLLRIFAMVNAGNGNPTLASDRPSGLSDEPQLENSWFRSYRIELAPGEETMLHSHSLPSVVIQVADGLIHVARSDGVTAELDARSDWVWHNPNQSYRIRNAGNVPSAVVVNEGR